MANKIKVINPNGKLNYKDFCVLEDKFQKQKAKTQICRKDRAKTSLTEKEKLNKFAQHGGIIYCGNVFFTYDSNMGMGLLITQNQKILNATINDFFKEIGV
jgi:hypothetical protein